MVLVIALAMSGFACRAKDAAAVAPASAAGQPVVVQGAMDIEVRQLAAALENGVEEHVGGWTFWRGTLDGFPVIVSKTLKGMENAAAATVLAAERYQPAAIVNQGTSGGHTPDLHVFDIVVGIDSVNVGSFKTGVRGRGQGSLFDDWAPLDLMRSEGSAGQDPSARVMRRFHADDTLVAAARHVAGEYRKGRVVEGVIASSNLWNSELDRIQRLHDAFGTTAEEMETASAAQIAGIYKIPFLGVRVLSNNITNGGAYQPATAAACQEFVRLVVRQYQRKNGLAQQH